MRNLFGMEVLAKVVEKGSFAAAARSLNLTSSAVSKQIARLEGDIGVTLLSRSTHKLSLTEAGRIFHDRSLAILREMDSARDAVREANANLTGTLKVHVTPGMTGRRFVLPALTEFKKKHPQLTVELTMSREAIDVVEDGFDLSILSGTKKDIEARGSSLERRQIVKSKYFVCAATDYFRHHSRPKTPPELAQHECLLNVGQPLYDKWWFDDGRRRFGVRVNGHFRANDGIAIQEAAVAGLGIARLLGLEGITDVRSLGLQILFEKETICDRVLWAIYPRSRSLPLKVSGFVDFLTKTLNP